MNALIQKIWKFKLNKLVFLTFSINIFCEFKDTKILKIYSVVLQSKYLKKIFFK